MALDIESVEQDFILLNESLQSSRGAPFLPPKEELGDIIGVDFILLSDWLRTSRGMPLLPPKEEGKVVF